MKLIVAPINPQSPGPDITNLQDGLLFLLHKGALAFAGELQAQYEEGMSQEQQKSGYGPFTRRLVDAFQKAWKLHESGLVDEPTAERLNAALQEGGAFTEPGGTGVESSLSTTSRRVVSGRVTQADGQPFAGGLIRAFHDDGQGALIRLGEDTTDADGRYTIRYEMLPVIREINLRLTALDSAGRPLQTSDLIANASPMAIVNLTLPVVIPPTLQRGMRSADVRLLIAKLRLLGFAIPVSDQDTFGTATEQAVMDFQKAHGLEASGVVDEVTAGLINAEVETLIDQRQPPNPKMQPRPFIVKGQVRRADGRPVVGVRVAAYDGDLRSEEHLGQDSVTDDNGRYEISYTADRFARAEKEAADLIVKVFGPSDVLLGQSSIHFNAPPVATVDVVLESADRPSEYEQLLEVIQPLLQGLALVELVENHEHQDIAFLSGETGQNRQRITFLVEAQHLAQRTELPAEIFYGLFRQGLPTELPAMMLVNRRLLRRAIDASLRENIIPARFGEDLEALLNELQASLSRHGLQAIDAGQRSTFGALLRTSAVPGALQERFCMLYANRDGRMEDFWTALRQQPDFQGDGVVDDLELTLQLGDLTGNNIPLVQALQTSRQDGTLTSLRDLAKRDVAQWQELIRTAGAVSSIPASIASETEDEKIENYANGIMETLKAMFPTTFVSLGVAKTPAIDLPLARQVLAQNPDLDLGRPLPEQLNWGNMSEAEQAKARAALEALRQESNMFPQFDRQHVLAGTDDALTNPIRQGVARFFDNRSDFDLSNTHIDTFLAQHAATAFDGVPEQDRAAVTAQLKTLQRVFRVTPRYEQMQSLMTEGLNSAFAIASVPPRTLTRILGSRLGGEDQVAMIRQRAEHTNARNTLAFGLVQYAKNGAMPVALDMPPSYGFLLDEAIKKMPALAELFGSLELCDCEHCRSVYSPAAYFVDLLQFLNPPIGNQPLDALRKRRPDLEYIKLTCENTNTPLPYVDLVNEILETYVIEGMLKHSWFPYDTGDTTAEELSANPQYTNAAAYDQLSQAVYPLTLPFHLPLAMARVYLEHLGSTFHEVMKTFQHNGQPTELEMACEYLEISPTERDILLGSPGHLLRDFYYPADYGPPNANLVTKLQAVREFLKQTGISYLELIELIKTRFINPLQHTPQGLTLNTPSMMPDPDHPNKTIPVDPCDLDHTTIHNLDVGTLDKLHRFIRLWRKLGWSIAEVDKMLAAFNITGITIPTAEEMTDVLLKLAELTRLRAMVNRPLLELLSLWSNIDIHGEDSLYKKLFLNKAVLEIDLVFSHKPVLPTNTTETITGHVPALVAALRVSDADLVLIRADAALDGDNAPLTLTTVSKLYRYIVLARVLKWQVKDMLTLKTLSGIDPFATPAWTNAFVEMAGKVRKSGFSLAQLNYIYRDLSDAPLILAPQRQGLLLVVRNLRDGLTRIAEENVLAADPAGELTRSKLALIFEATVVDQMMQLLNGSALYKTPLPAPLPTLTFPSSPGSKVAYNAAGQELSFVDAMTEAEKSLLLALSQDKDYRDAINKLFGTGLNGQTNIVTLLSLPTLALSDSGQKIAYDATAGQLRFSGPMTLNEQAILLDLSPDATYQEAINNLFQQPRTFLLNTKAGFLGLDLEPPNPDPVTQLLDTAALSTEQRFGYILQRLLPYLKDSLSRNLVKQTLGDALKLDSAFVALLLDKLDVQTAMADCLALTTPGLAAAYFAGSDFSGSPTGTAIDFAGAQISCPSGTHSVRWTGMILAPNNGNYTFYLEGNGDGTAQLWIGENAEPILAISANQWEIPLKAGELYDIRLELTGLVNPPEAALLWSSPTTPKVIIPAGSFYPASVFDTFADAFTLLHKIALLVNNFKLTEKELDYLSAHGEDFQGVHPADGNVKVDFDLNALPLHPAAFTPALFNQWQRLYDLVKLRDNLSQVEVSLIDVFGAASLEEAQQRLVLLTGWDAVDLAYLIDTTGFGLAQTELRNEIWPARLYECFRLMKRLGASAEQLFTWPSIGQQDLIWTDVWNIAQEIKRTVKAKYDEEQWLAVARPLSDRLRESQRAALVAYVLAQPKIVAAEITDSNQLFEYFLIDVNMDPCFMTSRIKQAISSAQLFIQRCLLNLEKDVLPGEIDSEQWNTWMKNYRVWEANRKVFLYPENWIEPELRDEKSPFFKELENELLQNDITKETVEQAFLHYLEKLDEVARLEIVGMVESEGTFHIFGRTFNPPHIYYYRQFELATDVWTAWEKVTLDIQGDHLIPLVWNHRLYLFWPIFEEKANKPQPQFESAEHKEWREETYPTWVTDYHSWKTQLHPSWEHVHGIWRQFHDFSTSLQVGDPNLEPPEPLEPKEPTEPSYNLEGVVPLTHWEIKLAWSEYKQTKWMPKQTSSDFVSVPSYVGGHEGPYYEYTTPNSWVLPDKRDFIFGVDFPNGVLNIHVNRGRRHGLGEALKPEAVEEVWTYGSFWMDGCRNKLYRYQDWNKKWAGGYIVPTDSKINHMMFEKDFTNNSFLEMTTDETDLDLPVVVLDNTPTPYRLLFQHDYRPFDLDDPPLPLIDHYSLRRGFNVFFYQDPQRTYFVLPIGKTNWQSGDAAPVSSALGGTVTVGTALPLRFHTFFHPHVCEFISSLNRDGIPGLLRLENQQLSNDPVTKTTFEDTYDPHPTNVDADPYPYEDVDFEPGGAYTLYNWELFFHIPLLVADRLGKNQRFDDAMKWFHYIFNPTDGSTDEEAPQRYWKFLPFYLNTDPEQQQIVKLLKKLNAGDPKLEKQVAEWRRDPFNPHLIARLRITAYQKTVVMKYINNLIAWGDQLFSRDTIESINEATQLYVMAYNLLGKRPEQIPPRGEMAAKSYSQLRPDLDAFSNAMVKMETDFPFSSFGN